MRKLLVALAAIILLPTFSTWSNAAEPSASLSNIINKLQPPDPAKENPPSELPIYSGKAELLKDIKEGGGYFYVVTGLSNNGYQWPNQTSEGVKMKKINIAYAKSIKKIIEDESGIPINVSFDSYPGGGDCGFAEMTAFVSRTLLVYTNAVRASKSYFMADIYEVGNGNRKIDSAREAFEKRYMQFQGCITDAGMSFEPFAALFSEMADARNSRIDMLKSERLERYGHQLSEAFLNSWVLETSGVLPGSGQTTMEGFLENLLTKASVKSWTVDGNTYKLSVIYSDAPLLITLVYSPQNKATTMVGVLKSKQLSAQDILRLTRVIHVN